MNEEEKSRRWEELISNEGVVVESKEKRVRREEKVVGVGVGRSYLSDLWLLVIMLVVWIGFFSIVEILGL